MFSRVLTREKRRKFSARLLVVWMISAVMMSFMNMAVFAATPATLDKVAQMRFDLIQDGASISGDPWPEWKEMQDFIKEWTVPASPEDPPPDPTSEAGLEAHAPEILAYYSALMSAFPSQSRYVAFCKDFAKWGSIDEETGEIIMPEGASGQKAEDNYDKLFKSFNGSAGAAAVGNVADKIFGTDNFDPDNNFLSPVMQWVYYIVNTLFNVFSQLVIWLFIGQTGADVLYIAVDFSRGVLTPFDQKGAGGAGGAMGGEKKGFHLPIISKEAYDAVYGGTTAGTGDSMKGKNKVLAYLGTRVPVIILAAVYLVMVFAGWWPTFISAVSNAVISFFTYVFRFFGFNV